MKKSVIKSYDELPLFMSAKDVSDIFGISAAGAYALMHEKGFPVLQLGKRMVVPKEKFRKWVEDNIEE